MEVVDIFTKANISDELTTKQVNDIVNLYSNLSSIDYVKFMASLLKDIRSKFKF